MKKNIPFDLCTLNSAAEVWIQNWTTKIHKVSDNILKAVPRSIFKGGSRISGKGVLIYIKVCVCVGGGGGGGSLC